jgi:hypothetical protein
MKSMLFSKGFSLARKFREMGIDGKFVYFHLFSSIEMDEPDVLIEGNNPIVYRLVSAGKDINHMPPPSQLTTEFSDVNAHTPVILSSQLTQGTTVNAYHGYVKGHYFFQIYRCRQ